jgi:hypothetical protein
MSDKEGNGNSITVHDDADLTTLVGRGGKYEKLVKNCFTNEDDGNVTWDEAKTFSMEGFLSTFAAENPARRASLQGWIKHYGLKNRFEKEVPKDGKPPCRLVVLLFCIRIYSCVAFLFSYSLLSSNTFEYGDFM